MIYVFSVAILAQDHFAQVFLDRAFFGITLDCIDSNCRILNCIILIGIRGQERRGRAECTCASIAMIYSAVSRKLQSFLNGIEDLRTRETHAFYAYTRNRTLVVIGEIPRGSEGILREATQVCELQTSNHTLRVSFEKLVQMKVLKMQKAYAKHPRDTIEQMRLAELDGVVFAELNGGTYRLQLLYPSIDCVFQNRAGNVTACLVHGVYGVRLPDGLSRNAMNVGESVERYGDLPSRTEPYDKTCIVCNKPAGSKCEGCLSVRYCGKDCQRSHWKEHKAVCSMITYSPSRSSGE